jgi:hypothetical protein
MLCSYEHSASGVGVQARLTFQPKELREGVERGTCGVGNI